MSEPDVIDRFFYHNFPRPRAEVEQGEKGLRILESLGKNGFLLVPERVTWRDPSGDNPDDPIIAVQKRICFTELSPPQLPAHAALFGPFAIEFEIATLRTMGAMPVIYVPDSTDRENGTGLMGTNLLARLADALQTLDALASTQALQGATLLTRITRLKGETTARLFDPTETAVIREYVDWLSNGPKQPFSEIVGALRSLSSLFYPTENLRFTGQLGYYRQREWRIFSGGVVDGVPTTRQATDKQRKELLEIDEEFFSRTLEFQDGPATIGERSHFKATHGGKAVLSLARRVIAPAAHVDKARHCLRDLGIDVPVVALESLEEER